MNKRIKIFTVVTIIMMLCLSICTSSFASSPIPAATSDFYVNDFAGVFTPEEKNAIMDKAIALSEKTDGIQIVISTIKSLEGDTIENYGYNMYKNYGIGKNDMGILILLATEDREIRIDVGRAMESYINDAKAGRFIDKYAIPYLKDNKFNEGLINLHSALVDEINTVIATASSSSSAQPANTSANINLAAILGVLGFLLFIAIIIYLIILVSKKIKKRRNYIGDLKLEISNLTNKNNRLVENHALETDKLNEIIDKLNQKNDSLQTNISDTNSKLSVLTDRYNRVLKIYPDADTKVDAMIEAEIIEKDKQVANLVDSLISSVIDLSPSKEHVEDFGRALSKYSSLTQSQKQYIKSDISKLQSIYKESVKLKEDYEKELEQERLRQLTLARKNKASSVTKEILSIISLVGIAKANDLSRLKNAKRLYEDLDSETQQYVDSSTISKLNSLISTAKRDKEEQEAAERRRRSSYTSRSTFNSSTSMHRGGFGGFGGRPGGGGASRRF